MRDAELAKRANRRRSGRVPLTFQEAWYKRGGANFAVSSSGSARIISETFTSADYTGAGPYKITYSHNLKTDVYIWHVFKTNTNGAIVVEHWKQGENDLELEFDGNTLDIKVIIAY